MAVDPSAANPSAHPPFQSHIELLRLFLTHRENIVDRIESVLNAQRKPIRYRSLLSDDFEKCFRGTDSDDLAGPRALKTLEAEYDAAGFKPRQVQHLYNDLIDPVEIMTRGIHCWQQTRWPGRSDRLHYAHTLFNSYVLRWLQFLSLRIFDPTTQDPSPASARLAEIQDVLDQLWQSSPAGQPAFVRDARWLIPLAQSLITDELAPYFDIAHRVAETLPEADVLEIHKAHVRMLGGHLTSQIRYYSTKDHVSIDEQSVVVRTRTSNALDLALLVQGLVSLLKAYDRAGHTGDENTRLEMAGAIYQGISPDPELFLNRIDMLRAYTMIEHVLIDTDDENRAAYSRHGQRHMHLLSEYEALIARLIPSLHEDVPRFKPVAGGCSPYGVVFGLPSNLIEHMALKAIDRDAETRFSLEDVFRDDVLGDQATSAAKLAWVNGWRKLPHVPREVQRSFDFPQQFADDIYNRMELELTQRDVNAELTDASTSGRLWIVREARDPIASTIPEVPARYFASSDRQLVAAHKAEPVNQAQLLRDRQEGHFLVSYETPGGWLALKKSLLAEVLGTGRDARIVGLPPHSAQVLQLMCAGLVVPENASHQPSAAPAIENA